MISISRTAPLTRAASWSGSIARGYLPVALVFSGSAAILAARMLAWPPSFAQDSWVYTLTGQALAAGRRPPLDLTMTTPKPLAALLATLVSPLPPDRAMAAVTVVFAAALVAATFTYGQRHGGAAGACAAVAALVLMPAFPIAFHAEQTDVLSGSLLVMAIVAGPRTRVALLVLMGLLRPQAWVLAGVAGYLAAPRRTSRRTSRRILAAIGCTLLPAALWGLSDAVVYGSPLASYRANERINSHVAPHSLVLTLHYLATALRDDSGVWIPIIGLIGFGVAIVHNRRLDPIIVCALTLLPAAIVLTWLRMPYNIRYTFPVAVLFPLGCAHLGGLVPLRRTPGWSRALGPVAALGILAVAAVTMAQTSSSQVEARATAAALSAAPAVDRALACGPVAVAGRPYSWTISLKLAVATRHPLADFRYAPWMTPHDVMSGTAAALVSRRAERRLSLPLRRGGWRPEPVALGTLWRAPGCRA
jgi:hypothetical protein